MATYVCKPSVFGYFYSHSSTQSAQSSSASIEETDGVLDSESDNNLATKPHKPLTRLGSLQKPDGDIAELPGTPAHKVKKEPNKELNAVVR